MILAALLLAAIGCAGGEDMTAEAIDAAQRTWEKADLRDYNLEWRSTGLMNGHYRVSVRGGKVDKILQVAPDGRVYPARPGTPEAYGVDGLFLVLRDELAQLKADRPFGQAKGTSTVLRLTTDPKLGYPLSYSRDVSGTPRGVSIDVLKLDPNPALSSNE